MHTLLTAATSIGSTVLAQAASGGIWDSVWPYLLMVFGFSFIVFVHELGHFAVAKWAGVRVERFAIGFGQELFGFTKGETRYSINILPLGGYVKMLGQEDFDDKSNELMFKEDPRSFVNKPVGHRMAIVSAGVIMNVILAGLLFMVVFMIGMQAMAPRIGFVEPDSPADIAGLMPGDVIERVNGETIHEFRDVSMAIQLAPPHDQIEFFVRRDGDVVKRIPVKPDYRRPENTREPRRQVIGIAPGVTREILWVGPDLAVSEEERPRIGDKIVEVDGREVNDSNINAVREILATAKEVWVERKDAKNPDAVAQRVRVRIPPQLAIYPADARDPDSISVLGLTPLMRFGNVDPKGRAALAGLEIGDTILSFDDVAFPTKSVIARGIADNSEFDVPFKVRKSDGRVVEGFVRPKRNRIGPGTIQAIVQSIPEGEAAEGGVQARFSDVRRGGIAYKAGIVKGDVITRVGETVNPTLGEFNRMIRTSPEKSVNVEMRKSDGRLVSVTVEPSAPGAIDASYTLVADDLLTTAAPLATVNGKPSPAAVAGIPTGATITKIGDESVSRWRDLVEAFRRNAGKSIRVTFTAPGEKTAREVDFGVPLDLRTALGLGPESRIIAIDGRRTYTIPTTRGEEEAHVGYHDAQRGLLTSLIGQKNVPVVFRRNAIAEPETGQVDVTADMIDPWLGRIAYAPNVDVGIEPTLLKGENAWQALQIGVHKTWYFILQVYSTINRMVFSQSVAVENLSGPLGIVSIGGQIARAGFVEFLFFMAIISANLAVINFLPLPIVDGGLMVFLIIEKIKGSPVSLRVQVATQVIGLFLIIGAFLFVTYNDVLRIWG